MRRIFLFLLLLQFFPVLFLAGQETVRMFESLGDSSDLGDVDLHLPYKKTGVIELNNRILDEESYDVGDKLLIDLFDDHSYLATIDYISRNINGTLTIRARFDDHQLGYLILSATGDLITATIRIPEKDAKYVIKTDAGSGYTYLKHIDDLRNVVIESGPPLIPGIYPQPDESQLERLKTAAAKTGEDTANIDVMIVYTPAAALWANKNEGSIFNTIAQSMAKAQLVLDNSETGITVTLVNSALVNYEEFGDNSAVDLIRLTASPDYNPWGDYWNGYKISGYMEEVHDWREIYGADLVAIFANVSDVGGLAWLLTWKTGMPELGFSLTRVQQASIAYTHIHEMGHNMGCHHHKEQNTSPGPTQWNDWEENIWSAGWRWMGDDNQMYCNVMTYSGGQFFEDGIDAETVPYFSNPDIEYMGDYAGHPEHGDNARTLREIKHVIAAYKEETDPELYTLHLTADPEKGGTVIGEGSFAEGALVNIAASASYEFRFETWTDEKGMVISNKPNFHYEMPGDDITLTANFSSEALIVTFSVVDVMNDPVQDAKISVSTVKRDCRSLKGVYGESLKHHFSVAGSSQAVYKMPSSLNRAYPSPFVSRTESQGDWIHWDSGENVTAIGMGGAAVFEIASRWEPPDIAEHHSKLITKVSFFPNYENCDYTIVIWVGEDAEEAYSREVENVVVGEWNTVELDTPFIIDSSYILWFGLILNTQDGFPAGCDGGPAVAGKGDMIRIGQEWVSMYEEYDLDFNWNLQAFVEDIVLYTDTNGYVSFQALKGEYKYIICKDGYKNELGTFEVVDSDITIEATLNEGDDPQCVVTFIVTDVDENPVEDAKVTFDEKTYTTCGEGKVVIEDVEVGFYYYSVTKKGYKYVEDLLVVDKENVNVNVALDHETYTLTLKAFPEQGGVVSGEGEYPAGEEVNVSTTVNEGWKFINWTDTTGNVVSDNKSFVYTMTAKDAMLTANFEDDVSVKDITDAEVKIFPNPARNKFYIESSEMIGNLRLIDVSGQVIKNVAVDQLRLEINVQHLPAGIYVMQIHTAGSVITERVQIVR